MNNEKFSGDSWSERSRSGSISILPFEGNLPALDPGIFIADGARIIGDVTIGKDSSVWFNVVIRGDVHWITIGERTNIQDNTVIHVTHKKCSTIIGSNVTIGHSAVVHGCTVEDYVLIGMGANILDMAHVEHHAFIAAGALVPPGFRVPTGTLAAGVPAKIIRDLRPEEISFIEQSAQNYIDYVKRYRQENA